MKGFSNRRALSATFKKKQPCYFPKFIAGAKWQGFSGVWSVKDQAFTLDATSLHRLPDPVKADDSEYLIRFQSAKLVQTAVQELLAIGEKWYAYGARSWPVSDPTGLANGRFNVADMITIAVILKRSAPDGTSLFNYGYDDDGRKFPSHSFRLWPCAGLRTGNGQATPLVVRLCHPHLHAGLSRRSPASTRLLSDRCVSA